MIQNMGGFTNDYTVRQQEISLEKAMLGSECYLDKANFCARDAKLQLEDSGRDLVIRMNAYVAAQRLKEREVTVSVSIERYATCWDMFKATYFPKWLLKRFPANCKEFTNTNSKKFTAAVCYPDVVMPDQRKFYVFTEGILS